MIRTTRGRFTRRQLVASFGGLALAAAVAGCGVGPSVESGPVTERVIVCESGTEHHDGIDTGSSVVFRVPLDAPLPPGCREG